MTLNDVFQVCVDGYCKQAFFAGNRVTCVCFNWYMTGRARSHAGAWERVTGYFVPMLLRGNAYILAREMGRAWTSG